MLTPPSKSVECQAIDWPAHRRWCTPASAASLNHRLVSKYIAKHQGNYIQFALEAMKFYEVYHHLEGCDRAVFMRTSARFLHVILQHVASPGRGRHNKLEFAAAAVRATSELEVAETIIPRLIARFPAVLLGFTVFDPIGPAETRVTTITHTFPWPAPDDKAKGTDKIIEAITAAEEALQEAGKTRVA